jgi:pyridinium-3,5-bisthiocarboxylic acid mononucleotide nickel chelatase
MRTLYFDCFAGVSGNMVLGGLIALGVDRDELMRQLRGLAPTEFDIEFTDVDRSGISSVHAKVNVPDESSHRHLSHIEGIIHRADVSAGVKERATAIFRRLAEAEAKIHGVDVEHIHFHEVGAMDAIVDIVGSCIGFELLGVEKFACSKIHVGSGFVEMAHGKFPVPPPAVVELLNGIPFYSTEIAGELATPTGVAIVTTVCDSHPSNPEIAIEKVGYGAGTREYKGFPNALRLILGETRPASRETDRLALLETNIDDLSPQILAYTMERSFEMGALDAWFTPIQMKKNRPAVLLSVLCRPEDRDRLVELIYTETSTLGVRVREIERECLEREVVTVETKFGPVDVKIGKFNGKVVNVMPEYEPVRELAKKHNVPFRVVSEAALSSLKDRGLTATAR